MLVYEKATFLYNVDVTTNDSLKKITECVQDTH